jgi:hypothetical protein
VTGPPEHPGHGHQVQRRSTRADQAQSRSDVRAPAAECASVGVRPDRVTREGAWIAWTRAAPASRPVRALRAVSSRTAEAVEPLAPPARSPRSVWAVADTGAMVDATATRIRWRGSSGSTGALGYLECGEAVARRAMRPVLQTERPERRKSYHWTGGHWRAPWECRPTANASSIRSPTLGATSEVAPGGSPSIKNLNHPERRSRRPTPGIPLPSLAFPPPPPPGSHG